MSPHEQLGHIFYEFSAWHTMEGTPFKPQAYELASEAVTAQGNEIQAIWKKDGMKGLEALPGIGRHIAEKIDEFYRTGHIKEYDALKKKFPVDIWGLSRIEGLGPKHIKQLWQELKVKNLTDLEKALNKHQIRDLPGFGEKSETRLAQGLALMKSATPRMPLEKIEPIAAAIIKKLKKIPGVKHCVVAGSIRRKKETVGDIDLIATSSKPELVMKAFTTLPEVEAIHGLGKTGSSVRLKIGIDADLRVVPDKVFGSTLQYFTGDRRHNIILREMAIRQGYKLNEYGLFKGKKLVPTKTEEDIYTLLGLKTPPPEKRLGADEFVTLPKKSKTAD